MDWTGHAQEPLWAIAAKTVVFILEEQRRKKMVEENRSDSFYSLYSMERRKDTVS